MGEQENIKIKDQSTPRNLPMPNPPNAVTNRGGRWWTLVSSCQLNSTVQWEQALLKRSPAWNQFTCLLLYCNFVFPDSAWRLKTGLDLLDPEEPSTTWSYTHPPDPAWCHPIMVTQHPSPTWGAGSPPPPRHSRSPMMDLWRWGETRGGMGHKL